MNCRRAREGALKLCAAQQCHRAEQRGPILNLKVYRLGYSHHMAALRRPQGDPAMQSGEAGPVA